MPKIRSVKCYKWFIVFCKGMIICIMIECRHKKYIEFYPTNIKRNYEIEDFGQFYFVTLCYATQYVQCGRCKFLHTS
jgi:hypothetical protein